MTTIHEWDTEVREKFHARQCALVEALYKLEEAGFRGSGPGFTYHEVGEDVYLTFINLEVLEVALLVLKDLFGNYKVTSIWNGYGNTMTVDYTFESKPYNLKVWFEAPIFPIEKFSPGCKIVERQSSSLYAVECPLKPEA